VTGELAALVLAHQGGWDEGLVVLVPLLIFVGLQLLGRRRGRRKRPGGRG
jgi:hypothetical protein